ncbi:MAG: hypothetical protein PHY16_19120 [Methylobacter sp.]|nr:hypothetical protein [Methylobacter sp.]
MDTPGWYPTDEAEPVLSIVVRNGWARRRHERSRDFCRWLGRDAHKSFRKNSDSPPLPWLDKARAESKHND